MIPVWLITAGLKAGGLARRAWAWLTASTAHLLLAAFALALLFAIHEHRAARRWHTAFDTEHAARLADRKSYAAAQVAAAAAQKAVNDAAEAKSRTLAQEADNARNDALAAADRAYADAHRVRDCRVAGAPGSAPTPDKAGAAPRGDGPSADAVVVSAIDFATMTANTERLLRVQRWGDELIAAGLATK